MKINENIPLKNYNTFGISANARYFCEVATIGELKDLVGSDIFRTNTKLILGEGANVLFTKDFDGLVVKPNFKGIAVVRETENEVFVKAFSGENWHDFVMSCCENNWNGLENLAYIPGSVGASPIQNIGAYGVEIKDVMDSLEAFNLDTKQIEVFSNLDCKFDYRESVFKHEYKGKYVICSVIFRLSKLPNFNTNYTAVNDELKRQNVSELSAKAIANAITTIRKSKLPDTSEIGSAGSFFKNPAVSQDVFQTLKKEFPNIVAHPADPLARTRSLSPSTSLRINSVEVPASLARTSVRAENTQDEPMKLSAGWLIEHAGWKGHRQGDAGVHTEQALVLVNYGNATGAEILNLAHRIIDSVNAKFGVALTPEVNIL